MRQFFWLVVVGGQGHVPSQSVLEAVNFFHALSVIPMGHTKNLLAPIFKGRVKRHGYGLSKKLTRPTA